MKKLALILTLLTADLLGVVPQYRPQDKKKFDSLISVRWVKIIGGEQKRKRIENLQQLSALMTNRLLSAIRGLGLQDDLGAKNIESMIRPVIVSAIGKTDLLDATRYAVYEFEKYIDGQLKRREGEDYAAYIFRIRTMKMYILSEALSKFNKYWGKVIIALKSLGVPTPLPAVMTIEEIKRLGGKKL